MIDREQIRERFTAIAPQLDERARRLLAATEARAAGYGGIAAVSQATGVAPSTIACGLQDLAAESPLAPGQVRRPGGGRKPLAADDPTLRADLLTLVEPDARADPMSPFAGPARACAGWRTSWRSVGTRSAVLWSVTC